MDGQLVIHKCVADHDQKFDMAYAELANIYHLYAKTYQWK
jgi:hypothetical protein